MAESFILENEQIRLELDKGSLRGEIRLKANGDRWHLDLVGTGGWLAQGVAPDKAGRLRGPEMARLPMPTGVRSTSEELSLIFERGAARMRASIRLIGPGPALEFSVTPQSWGKGCVSEVVFPGSIYQVGGTPSQVVIPSFQGLLFTGKGDSFEEHNLLRMSWWGVLGKDSSYIAIINTADDKAFYLGKDEEGVVHTKVRWLSSLRELSYERRVTYYFKPGVKSYVPLAKHFREHAKEAGLYRSLRDKIAERPKLDRLIGAAHVFLGYQAAEGVDYLNSLRRLKQMGLERAFCFPFFFANWGTPFVIRGVDAIAQRDLVEVVQQELGYLCSPWVWNWEILTRDPDYSPELIVKRSDGTLFEGWRIEEDIWQVVNQRKATELYKKYERDFMVCDAFHFDVTTSHGLLEDHDPIRPMTRSEDRQARVDIFRWMTERGKVVGSEGFWDWAAPYYDYGTTKLSPAFGDARYWTIPLMGLVYHDAVIHAWWEVDGYNDFHCFTGRGGQPILQSLQDVLYNDPPLIFPFGRQYYWVDRRARTVEFHEYTLETPGVLEAVKLSIEVAGLHRAHGLEEMLDHRFMTADGSVQETLFESGTRMSVNFSGSPAETSEGTLLPPYSRHISDNG